MGSVDWVDYEEWLLKGRDREYARKLLNKAREYKRNYMRKYRKKKKQQMQQFRTQFPDIYDLIFGKPKRKKKDVR